MTGVVRPVRARIVREEYAAQHVSHMSDARPAGLLATTPTPLREVDPADYHDAAPGLYVYRLRRDDQVHVGVVGAVLSAAFVDGRVRGHEAVQPDRVQGLVDHWASAATQSELVALLHRSGPAAHDVVARTQLDPPLIHFTGPDGWEQTVWRVADEAGRVLTAELGEGVHYIADGHHRVAANLSVWQAAGQPPESTLMCVIYPFGGLRMLAFHRRITGPADTDRLHAVLAERFEVRAIAGPGEATGCFAAYVAGRWYDAVHPGDRPPGVAGLDIAILNDDVLDPLLGQGPAAGRLEITSALTPVEDLTAACDADGGVLFALRPPSLEQLTEIADRGEVMPPKTTYFDPKPYAGIFVS